MQTTPLRHFPYETENVFCDKYIFEENPKMMTHTNPFDLGQHPSSELPFDFLQFRDQRDSIFNPGSNDSYYQEQAQNFEYPSGHQIRSEYPHQLTIAKDVPEDTEDEEEEEKYAVQLSVPSRKVTTPSARKYNKKSEKEKNSPEYLQARKRNNEAVRRTRQKNKEAQEVERKKTEKLKQENKDLKAKCDEQEKAIRLIRQLQNELRANPNNFSTSAYPSLTEILRFK